VERRHVKEGAAKARHALGRRIEGGKVTGEAGGLKGGLSSGTARRFFTGSSVEGPLLTLIARGAAGTAALAGWSSPSGCSGPLLAPGCHWYCSLSPPCASCLCGAPLGPPGIPWVCRCCCCG